MNSLLGDSEDSGSEPGGTLESGVEVTCTTVINSNFEGKNMQKFISLRVPFIFRIALAVAMWLAEEVRSVKVYAIDSVTRQFVNLRRVIWFAKPGASALA